MSNAFADVIDADDETTDTADVDATSNDNDETVEPSDFSSFESFADSVRPTLPYDDNKRNDDRYEDPETGDKADDTDPRGLFRPPSLNELRYYAREGPYGRTVVEKPIDDAFKHGFAIRGDNTNGKIKETLDEIESTYKLAKKKSRRDGLAILFHVVEDTARDVGDPINTDDGTFAGLKIWTVDNLSDDLTEAKAAEYLDEFDSGQIYVSEGHEDGGVAVVDDISHPRHGEVVGYGVEPRSDSENTQTVTFVNADRCHAFVNGEHVDGQLGNNITGQHIGESILTPILQPLKAAQMGFWSISQILLRYSAPLHAVEPPDSWTMEDYDDARAKMGNLSMASDTVLPPGSELSVAEGVSEFDPEPYYDTLTKAICGGTVFTKPILEGTQGGTVSGSETSLKAYFSEIQVMRQQDIEDDLRDIVRKIASYDQSQIPRVAAVEDIEFEWGPLFKLNALERAEGAVSLITAATNGIKNYVLTPDEARELLTEEWATFDIDVDLDDLAEPEWDEFDRINIREAGQGPQDDEPVNPERANPQTAGRRGGRPQGSTGGQDDMADELSEISTDTLRDELSNRNTE